MAVLRGARALFLASKRRFGGFGLVVAVDGGDYGDTVGESEARLGVRGFLVERVRRRVQVFSA